jgi:DNA-binding NtrC family response regulator
MGVNTEAPFGKRRSERDALHREIAGVPVDSIRPGQRPTRVLLVEDEDPFRELLQAYLESQGFSVHTVRDAQDGASWLGLNAADVVVTDLCMPKSDGIELLMALKQRRSTIPIIVMSGGVRGEMAGMLRAATLLGAKRTLAKPFPLHLLAVAIREALPANQ